MRIRPTIHLGSFICVTLALWYAAMSQSNAVAYLLFFLVLGAGLVSFVHGVVNLRGLQAAAIRGAHGYAGRPYSIPVRLHNAAGVTRHALQFRWRSGTQEDAGAISSGEVKEIILPGLELPRGIYELASIRAETRYPFGLFLFSKELPVQGSVDIYPHPAGRRDLPGSHSISESAVTGKAREGEDFAGVRTYRLGDSQRHVDWRAVAREMPMMVKQFEGATGGLVYLDLDQTLAPDLESRLSQLALWILEAEAQDVEYALRLGGEEIGPSRGLAHQHECLRALARFPAK